MPSDAPRAMDFQEERTLDRRVHNRILRRPAADAALSDSDRLSEAIKQTT